MPSARGAVTPWFSESVGAAQDGERLVDLFQAAIDYQTVVLIQLSAPANGLKQLGPSVAEISATVQPVQRADGAVLVRGKVQRIDNGAPTLFALLQNLQGVRFIGQQSLQPIKRTGPQAFGFFLKQSNQGVRCQQPFFNEGRQRFAVFRR